MVLPTNVTGMGLNSAEVVFAQIRAIYNQSCGRTSNRTELETKTGSPNRIISSLQLCS